MRLLKRREIETMLSIGKQSIYNLIRANGFPEPVRLSSKRIGWLEHEVVEWVQKQPRGAHSKSRFFPFNRAASDPAVPDHEPAPPAVPLAVRARKAKKRAGAKKPRKAS